MLRRSLLACLTCLVACLGFASADPITFAVTDSGQFGSLDLGTGNFTPIADAYASACPRLDLTNFHLFGAISN